ncbi:hypothetical protein, partial [Streptosporangium minutum]
MEDVGASVGRGGGSLGGSETSGSGLSHEIAQLEPPPAEVNATRPVPLSPGSAAVTQIMAPAPALSRPRRGWTFRPPEVVADHESAASRAESRICPAPSPMSVGHETASRPALG